MVTDSEPVPEAERLAESISHILSEGTSKAPSMSRQKKREPNYPPFIVPSKTRSQIEQRRQKEIMFPGYDDETERLEEKGIRLIGTTEHFVDNGTTRSYEPPSEGNDAVYHQQLRRDLLISKLQRKSRDYWDGMYGYPGATTTEGGLNV